MNMFRKKDKYDVELISDRYAVPAHEFTEEKSSTKKKLWQLSCRHSQASVKQQQLTQQQQYVNSEDYEIRDDASTWFRKTPDVEEEDETDTINDVTRRMSTLEWGQEQRRIVYNSFGDDPGEVMHLESMLEIPKPLEPTDVVVMVEVRTRHAYVN